VTGFIAPTPEHTCDHCYRPRPPSNLTTQDNGERWCPFCLAERADYDSKHQVPAPPGRANEDHGLRVVDVERGNAGRLAALARRRSA